MVKLIIFGELSSLKQDQVKRCISACWRITYRRRKEAVIGDVSNCVQSQITSFLIMLTNLMTTFFEIPPSSRSYLDRTLPRE
jgi:hypothetical protein